MKNLITTSFFILFTGLVFGQTSRMTSPESAREYSTAQQSRTVLPLLQKAERELQVLDFEEAFFTLENAVAQNPNSAEALMARAVLKKRMGMDEEAQIDVTLAKKINPHIEELYGFNGNKSLLNLIAFAPEQALQSLDPAQRFNYYFQFFDEKLSDESLLDDKYEALTELIELIEKNETSTAETKANELLANFPNSPIILDLKGIIALKNNQLTAARSYFQKAILVEPEFAIAWTNLGSVEMKLKNFKASKFALDKAIALETDLTKAYFVRAKVLKKMGKQDAAVKDYDTIINKTGKNYTEAFLNRGLTKKMLGDFNGALRDINMVVDEMPDSPEVYQNRGNIYLLFGLTRKAIDDYTKAIELDSNFAEAHYNRAMAHYKIFDMISGCRDLRKSIELGFEKATELERYFCY